MDTVTEETHRERSYDRNIRHIAYSLLRDVSFQGEPVTPKAISEGEDEFGKHFKVEKLRGQDLTDFMFLPESEVSTKQKFEVLLHITRQLQEIDKAGFILFDRNSGNIRVLDWKDKISTRQIDIENYYDKSAEAMYSSGDQKSYEEMMETLKEKKVDLWAPTVEQLVSQAIAISKNGNRPDLVELFEKQEWKPTAKRKGLNLKEHEKVLLKALKTISS